MGYTMKVYGCVCISPDGKILLVRNRNGHKWSFPKGHRESSDNTELDCARRELMEETGLYAPEQAYGSITLRAGIYYVFLFDTSYMIQPVVHDQKEVDKVDWFSLKELPDLCNVDVSMFKNLIKLYRNIDTTTAEKTMKFLLSEYSVKKFEDMNMRLERKANENNRVFNSIASTSESNANRCCAAIELNSLGK
jgi:8-oxo-dGTP pyrophosphatase MutT (NUDIX family)